MRKTGFLGNGITYSRNSWYSPLQTILQIYFFVRKLYFFLELFDILRQNSSF